MPEIGVTVLEIEFRRSCLDSGIRCQTSP